MGKWICANSISKSIDW